MLTVLTILAQQSQVEPAILGGNAGWVGTGLLGAVLSWIFFWHLPAKDKQLKELIDSQLECSREERKNFREALDRVVEHCSAENERLADKLDVLGDAVGKLSVAITHLESRSK